MPISLVISISIWASACSIEPAAADENLVRAASYFFATSEGSISSSFTASGQMTSCKIQKEMVE
jgi:hypothetical protein